MKKKILSALLAAAMVTTSCLPVFAEGEVQPQPIPETPAIVNEEPEEFCECGLAKGHEGDCQKAAEEFCECGLAKDHEGECQKATEELCKCGLTKGHEGECQKAAEELCECGFAKGHEGECQKAAEAPVVALPVQIENLFDRVMACSTPEELEALMMNASEDERNQLTSEQMQRIEAYAESMLPEPLPPVVIEVNVDQPVVSEIVYVTVNYTDVAPLVDTEA